MDMAVKNGLTCHFANIHANVEAFHCRIPREDIFSDLSKEVIAGQKLLRCKLKVILCMAFGYHQCMAVGDRKGIPNRVGKFVLGDDPLGWDRAEKA